MTSNFPAAVMPWLVNEDETVAEVTDQLFVMIWESGESRPADLIARGPGEDLYLGLGTSGPSQRETPSGLETP
ncbi:MAG: hypothetical protein EA415_15620 [Sphaerobacteraceae bacterium]|nr:MAG: hypothetical protein EA415_15620 [Sphaerobacteraceae bacterium]